MIKLIFFWARSSKKNYWKIRTLCCPWKFLQAKNLCCMFFLWPPPATPHFPIMKLSWNVQLFFCCQMLTSNVFFFVCVCFSHASAFWLRSQREEQTQVHGPVHVSAPWHDRHGGSGECVSSSETSLSITVFSWHKHLPWNENAFKFIFFLAQNGPLGGMTAQKAWRIRPQLGLGVINWAKMYLNKWFFCTLAAW